MDLGTKHIDTTNKQKETNKLILTAIIYSKIACYLIIAFDTENKTNCHSTVANSPERNKD